MRYNRVFDLNAARGVVLWQRDRDDIVTPAHARWLVVHIPGATLHLLPGDGHVSIGLRLPEIIDDLAKRARRAR